MAKGNGIKKISYSTIRKELIETGFASDAHFMVEENPFEKGMYMITVYHVAYPYSGRHIAMGKSLKGYKGDIIYLQYDGYCYGTGDYRLVSDRHGLICKIKQTNLVEKLADVDKERSRKEVHNANNMSFNIRFGLTPNDWEMRLDIDIAHLELVEIGIREEILRKRGK